MENYYDERSVVLILGAGASSVFGFPLQEDMWQFLANYKPEHDLRDNKEFVNFIRWNYGENIEEALTILSIAARDRDITLSDVDIQANALNDLKAKIARAFDAVKISKTGVKIFKNLIDQLQIFKSVTFLSLNWDLGLEIVLEEMKFGVDYGIRFDQHYSPKSEYLNLGARRKFNFHEQIVEKPEETKTRTFLVLKPHGSINWSLCPVCRRLYCYHYFFFDSLPGFVLDPTSFCCICSGLSHEDLETILIPPALNKGYSFNYFDSVSRIAHQKLMESDIIIFIGCSFREADYDIKYILTSALASNRTLPLDIDIITFGSECSWERIKSFFIPKLAGSPKSEAFARDRTKNFLGKLNETGGKRLSRLF